MTDARATTIALLTKLQILIASVIWCTLQSFRKYYVRTGKTYYFYSYDSVVFHRYSLWSLEISSWNFEILSKKMNKYCNLAFWLMGKWKLQISWIWLIVQRSRVILGLASTSKTYLAYVWPCNVRGYLRSFVTLFPKSPVTQKLQVVERKGSKVVILGHIWGTCALVVLRIIGGH